MSGDSININNLTLLGIQYFWKIFAKASKNYPFWSNLHKNRVTMGYIQNKKLFFSEIAKPDHKFSKRFILSKFRMFWLSYECFSLAYDAFLLKSVISSHSSCQNTYGRGYKSNILWLLSYIPTFYMSDLKCNNADKNK